MFKKRTAKNTHAKRRQQKLRRGNLLNFWNKITTRPQSQTPKVNSGSKADLVLFFCILGLVLFGWVMVYSSSFYVASQRTNTIFYPHNPFHFFILQFFWIIVGAITGFIVYKIPLKHYSKLIIPAILVIIFLLILVLILPKELNGAKLWIKIGPYTLQPSEFAKPVLIVYLSGMLAKPWKPIAKTWQENFFDYLGKRFLPFALVVGPILLLVFLGKDLTGAAMIGFICLSLFFLSDSNKIHNLFSGVMTLLGIGTGILFAVIEPYRLQRVKTYFNFLATGEIADPLNTGFQLRQVLIAVGTGGLLGYGFGQSYQKYFYLQETAFSDTIFAVIAEEFGLVGSLILIIVFLIFFFRGLKIAQNARTKNQSLMALGIISWLSIQTIIHLAVNVGLIPLTGVTLPFISYGGSSLMTSLIGAGILLNISKHVKVD